MARAATQPGAQADRRGILRGLLAGAAMVMTGCAVAPRTPPEERLPNAFWTGRLALAIESDPPQSFSAAFELKGNARSGELSLYSPLGSTLAVMQWDPSSATLRSNGGAQNFPSLDALVLRATGAPIPVPALFDWLGGTATEVEGWHADLSGLSNGRLAAGRLQPLPRIQLRIAIEKS